MPTRSLPLSALLLCVSAGLLLAACSSAAGTPMDDWFNMEMTNVLTGQPFTINDFSGKVVLLGTMAQWCPNCLVQQANIRKAYEELGHPADLILVSLDVDVNEDEESLKKYADEWGFDWRFAVSPTLVSRALGNLYTAQYLNPPLDPMMIIDREGNVHHLPYGIKDVDALQIALEPFLSA